MGGGGAWLYPWVEVGYIVIDVPEYWFCVLECTVKKNPLKYIGLHVVLSLYEKNALRDIY